MNAIKENKEMLKECNEKQGTNKVYAYVKKKAYQLYQLDWLKEHGYTLEEVVKGVSEYAEEASESFLCAFRHWENDYGFKGAIYASYDEFCNTEYLDFSYMRKLLPNHILRDYINARIIENADKIDARREKVNAAFTVSEDLKNCNESLLFDSDTEIASILFTHDGKKIGATLMVRGATRIVDTHTDCVYECVKDYTPELLAMIKNGTLYTTNQYYIDNNNWFELMYCDENDAYVDGDVIENDLSAMSNDELKDFMYKCTVLFFDGMKMM